MHVHYNDPLLAIAPVQEASAKKVKGALALQSISQGYLAKYPMFSRANVDACTVGRLDIVHVSGGHVGSLLIET